MKGEIAWELKLTAILQCSISIYNNISFCNKASITANPESNFLKSEADQANSPHVVEAAGVIAGTHVQSWLYT